MSCVNWCNFSGTIPSREDLDSELASWEILVGTLTRWFRNEILGILEGKTPVVPTQMYIAAHTSLCDAVTPGTEVVGNGYTRTAISFERVDDIQRWNPADVTSTVATASWGEIKSFSLWDDPVDGNYYAFGNLVDPVTVDASKALVWSQNRVIVGLGVCPP